MSELSRYLTDEEEKKFIIQLAESRGDEGITAEDVTRAINEFQVMLIHEGFVGNWRKGNLAVGLQDGQLAWRLTDKEAHP